MTEELPPAGYAADVPHPAIGVSIDVPDHWTVLDLNPDTWDPWLDAFLDQRLAGRPTASEERVPAREALLDLLRHLHQEKVFMAAILAADLGGDVVSASATLAWRKLDLDDGWNLEGLRQVHLRAPAAPGEDLVRRRVRLIKLLHGDAVKLTTFQTVRLPNAISAESVAVSITQYLVPIPDSSWLAVLTATTGNPSLALGVEEVADTMAASFIVRAKQ